VVDTPSEIETLKKSDEQMKQEIRELKDALGRKMQQEIDAKAVAVKQETLKSIQVTMQQKLVFSSASIQLSAAGRKALASFGKTFKQSPTMATIRIIGHTDNQPVSQRLRKTYTDNWDLSAARAAAVARYLIWGMHIDPQRIHIEGSAHTQSVASNATKKGRAANRRIELFVEAK